MTTHTPDLSTIVPSLHNGSFRTRNRDPRMCQGRFAGLCRQERGLWGARFREQSSKNRERQTRGFGDLHHVLSERRAKKQSDLDGVSDWSGLKRENWLRWRAFLASGTKTRTRPVKGSGGNELIHHKDTTVK